MQLHIYGMKNILMELYILEQLRVKCVIFGGFEKKQRHQVVTF